MLAKSQFEYNKSVWHTCLQALEFSFISNLINLDVKIILQIISKRLQQVHYILKNELKKLTITDDETQHLLKHIELSQQQFYTANKMRNSNFSDFITYMRRLQNEKSTIVEKLSKSFKDLLKIELQKCAQDKKGLYDHGDVSNRLVAY